jgi:2-polyprenyl-3-methyl-5-hydroxy-6-metoxy-1,4-benzoquinol methylase
MTSPYIYRCPVGCSSELTDTDIVLAEGPLRRCSSCGQLLSGCSEEQYNQSMREFDDPAGTWPEDFRRLKRFTGQMLGRLSAITGKKNSRHRLLDVGCSSGAFIAVAEQFGLQAEGVEPSSGPARTALKKGLQVYQGFLEDIALPAELYNIITLFEVIEHLRNPLPLIKECHRLLQTGGFLIIRTGNAESWTTGFMRNRWEYFHLAKHGGHISFFNHASLRLLAHRAGFTTRLMQTRGVGILKRADASPPIYRLCKMLAELMNLPSRLAGKGDELIAFLEK